MIGAVEYSCQVLNGTNKVGTLKKNPNGTYPMIVGALNMVNNKGEYYEFSFAKKFFDNASDLCRMAEKGVLRGEYGHPNQEVGQSDDKFVERLLRVDEKSVACFHKRVSLDFDHFKDVNGKPFIGIMSDVEPDGPYGPTLAKQLDNPNMNVCFSIRCFSMPHRSGGRIVKEMRHVVTFDYVTEPGIATANKYAAPALESHNRIFTQGTVTQAARNIRNAPGSNESSRIGIMTLMNTMGYELRDTPQAKRNFMELLNTPRF